MICEFYKLIWQSRSYFKLKLTITLHLLSTSLLKGYMKKLSPIYFVMIFMLQFIHCGIFVLHGWCDRSIHGNIEIKQSFTTHDSTTLTEMKVTIKEKSRSYGTYHDYDAELQGDGSYKTEKSTFKEQDDCDNNCGSKSLPDSLNVIISNLISEKTIFDTVYNCTTFTFQDNDIILPNITLK